jgi:excisionase family DNA binding protein
MSATKTKPIKLITNGPVVEMAVPASPADVLTLSEAAAYLRIAEAEVIRMVDQQGLPGRLIGDEWRFLKTALQEWLRTPPPGPSKEAVLSRIGSWRNDPDLEQELTEIHKRRGRPTAESGK